MGNKDTVSNRNKVKVIIIDWLFFILGSLVYAIAIHVFTSSNDIAPGGVTGIATMVNFLTNGFPIGITIYLINIPLLLMGYKFIGKSFFLKTVVVLTLTTLLIDFILPLFFPVYIGNKILASAFGGVLMGVGCGILYLRGATTGGSDIVVKLFMRKVPHLRFGTLMFTLEALIIACAGFVYQDIEASLYALIASFGCSAIIDKFLYGVDKVTVIQIISTNPRAIADEFINKLSRGVTILKAEGAFSKTDREVIMCAIRNAEFYNAKNIVYNIDPNAFIIVSEAKEVLGDGFKPIKENKT